MDIYTLRDFFRTKGQGVIKGFMSDSFVSESAALTKADFRKAVKGLGFVNASKASIDECFRALDDDHSGTIELHEFEHKLHRVGERPENVINFTAHDLRDYLRFSFGKRLIDQFKVTPHTHAA